MGSTLKPLQIGELTARVPIIQGGMGVGISLAGLAARSPMKAGSASSPTAGIGMNEPDFFRNFLAANDRALRREIRAARAATTGILGVNIMVALSNYADLVRVAIEEGIDVIFSGAGLPMHLPELRPATSRTKLAPIVSSGRAAALLCRRWTEKYNYLPDAMVVEGPRAGGHLGFKLGQLTDPAFALERLVPEVLAAVQPFAEKAGKPLPIIAAGGLYTGADIYKYLEMGASGAQLGTRFVATHECDASLELSRRISTLTRTI